MARVSTELHAPKWDACIPGSPSRCSCNGLIANPSVPIQSAIAAVQSFADLCPFVHHAEIKLSFWGSRFIQINGCQGYLLIDALASKVLQLLEKNPHFDEQERSHGKTIGRCIDLFYDESDQQVENSNFFTKMLAIIRSFAVESAFPNKISKKRTG